MNDVNKTEATPATNAQPWLRIAAGVLQFIGGGLIALHDDSAPAQAREPEQATDREIRERLAALGIKVHHADTLRQAWTQSASPPTTAPSGPASHGDVPVLSFEEFAAAAAAHLEGQLGERDRTKPSAPAAPTASRGSDNAADRSEDPRLRMEFLDLRISALEEKCHSIMRRIMEATSEASVQGSAAPSDLSASLEDTRAATTEGHAPVLTTSTDPSAATSTSALSPSPARSETDSPPNTVVQGPWIAGRSETSTSDDRTQAEDVQARRVAALERQLETLTRLAEGLPARARPKGPPPDS